MNLRFSLEPVEQDLMKGEVPLPTCTDLLLHVDKLADIVEAYSVKRSLLSTQAQIHKTLNHPDISKRVELMFQMIDTVWDVLGYLQEFIVGDDVYTECQVLQHIAVLLSKQQELLMQGITSVCPYIKVVQL